MVTSNANALTRHKYQTASGSAKRASQRGGRVPGDYQDRDGMVGTLWANRNPETKRYVVKYDDPNEPLLYTDRMGHTVREGDPEDAQQSICILNEILLLVNVARKESAPCCS